MSGTSMDGVDASIVYKQMAIVPIFKAILDKYFEYPR